MKSSVQRTFGKYAQNYVSSPTHAAGYSLGRLVEVMQPQPDGLCLDIATGGGHVALACARAGLRVLAGDLTFPMLQTARTFITQQHESPLQYAQLDAEALPFADASFDYVACRIAPHHFPHIRAFVADCARVLKPGGKLGLVDIISPESHKAARYTNLFEQLRDPSHVWAYSMDEWTVFLENAGLRVQHTEQYGVQQNVGVWAARVGCDQQTVERLRVMLLQAPEVVREWYQITAKPGLSPYVDIPFHIQQMVMVGELPMSSVGSATKE